MVIENILLERENHKEHLKGKTSDPNPHDATVPLSPGAPYRLVHSSLLMHTYLIFREGGPKELGKGWAPTFFGYSCQGLGKFGLYEVFKVIYSDIIGEVRKETFYIPW